jgi:hypothetical protein
MNFLKKIPFTMWLIIISATIAFAAAGVGITTWSTVSTLEDGDIFAMTDVSDTSGSDDGTSKTINYLNLKANLKTYLDTLYSSLGTLTTKGDLYTYDSDNARLPVGTNSQYLVSDSTEATGLKWEDFPTTGTIAIPVFTARTTMTTNIANTNADITWNTEIKKDTGFTHAAASTDITFDFDGWVDISFSVGIDGANSRVATTASAYINTGGGFSKITTDIATNYAARNTDIQMGGVVLNFVLQVSNGDVIKFNGATYAEGGATNIDPNETRVIIKRVDNLGTGIKGDKGDTGPAGGVDTSGTPIVNDFARFVDADTIEGRSYAEVRSDLNVEDGADVTDTANVTAAGALMDSEVDADIKTLSLPANTTISTFGASLVDDSDASTARTTIDVDQAGTDNSTNVTLAGVPDYITINGQEITINQIDLTTDVTGILPGANVADGADSTAIHDNVAGEFVVVAEKTAVVGNDEILIEDSEDSNNKKSAKISNLFNSSTIGKYTGGTEADFHGTLINPDAIYAITPSLTIVADVPAAFTITALRLVCDADPTTEITVTFAHKATGVGYGTPTTIEAVTTVNGVANVTSGIDDATIPADVKIIMTLSDPDDALKEVAWQIEGDWD